MTKDSPILQDFTDFATFEKVFNEASDKDQALLAQMEPEWYDEYCVAYGLIEEDGEEEDGEEKE